MAVKSAKTTKSKKAPARKGQSRSLPGQKSVFETIHPVPASFPPEKFSAFEKVIPPISSSEEPVKRNIPHPPQKVSLESCELPSGYNSTYITLIARDPYWLYAYWEIAPSAFSDLRDKIGDEINRCAWVLRVYDVTCIDFNGTNANSWFDIETGPSATNWYINFWKDGASVCAEFGLRAPSGRFFSFARSNFVHTPRASSSWRKEEIWLDVKNDSPNDPPFVIFERDEEKNARKNSAKNNPGARNSQNPRRRKIFLTEADIRAYYSKLFPLLKNILLRRKGIAARGANPRFNLKDGISLDDILLRGTSRGQFIKKILLGASEEMLVFGGGSEQLSSGASTQEQKKRTFFFEIGTELIVYGRTEPDAEVWLADKKIKLRQDGTFTLRFALPDGKIPLDFSAISNDKVEKRRIATSVERVKTIYEP
ncbi:MAG: DUF4912 domain-containing protein [Candidatus Omnitrophota bacterium]|nr:DUF4912 domain-containing protein [Candidatus Omnitrophota bacterium]